MNSRATNPKLLLVADGRSAGGGATPAVRRYRLVRVVDAHPAGAAKGAKKFRG